MRDKLITLVKVAISIGLIALAFSRVDFKQVAAQLIRANPVYFALALLLYMLAIVVNGAKWQVLLRAQGVRVPFGAVVRFIFVGFFFNNFLPANVGGDVMRGYSLARYTDRAADSAVSVIVDRVIGLMAYMTTAVIAAIIAVNFSGHSELQRVEWVAMIALAALIAGFGILLSRRLRAVIARIFQIRFLAPLAPLYGRISDAFGAYRFQYKALITAFGVGLVVVLMIPITIAGIGVMQTAYTFFFTLVGVPADHALAVSILMQAIMFLGSLPGGVLWLVGRRQQTSAAAQN